jgi:hypothetical protein
MKVAVAGESIARVGDMARDRIRRQGLRDIPGDLAAPPALPAFFRPQISRGEVRPAGPRRGAEPPCPAPPGQPRSWKKA